MSIPPLIVRSVRNGWQWQWKRLMTGLGPADDQGNYQRPDSTPMQTLVPEAEDLPVSYTHLTLPTTLTV